MSLSVTKVHLYLMPMGERIFHHRDLKDQVQSQTHPLVDDPNLGLAHTVHFHQHPVREKCR